MRQADSSPQSATPQPALEVASCFICLYLYHNSSSAVLWPVVQIHRV